MKKFTTIGIALVAAGALTGTAVAQAPGITATGSIDQSGKGSKKKPAKLAADVDFTLPAEAKATLNTITYSFPKSVKISGAGYKKGTKVGSGTATALAGSQGIDFDFDIKVQSAKKISLELESQTPGIDVAATFPGTIKGQKLVVTIPANVQQPAPGLYSWVTGINSKLSAKTVTKGKGKKKKTYNFVSTTAKKCASGQEVGIQLDLTPNGASTVTSPVTGTAEMECE